MNIGIIGAGWSVGRVWVKAGHHVLFSSRYPEKQQRAVAALEPLASGGTVEQAAAFGQVVLIAIPYRALGELGQALQGPLAGKVVLDACNPYAPDPASLIRDVNGGFITGSDLLIDGGVIAAMFAGKLPTPG